jgi:hypothetical protein
VHLGKTARARAEEETRRLKAAEIIGHPERSESKEAFRARPVRAVQNVEDLLFYTPVAGLVSRLHSTW